MKKHFYIFRHGQTIWNAEGRPQGQHPYPVPLTVLGQEQATALGEQLKDKKIKKLISSDLLRAVQTAQIVSRAINIPVEYDKRLREVNYGILNGKYSIEKEEIYPDYKNCYSDYNQKYPEGECFAEVGERMKEAIKDMAIKYNHRNIAVCSHGNAIGILMNIVFKQDTSYLNNCEYIHITYDADKDKWEIVEIPPNQTNLMPKRQDQ